MTKASTVLVVDDRPNWQDVCSRALSLAGYHCDCAKDADEAISKLRSATYRLVVINYNLGKSGLLTPLLQRIQSDFSRIPVVIMSGSFAGSLEEVNLKVTNLMARHLNVKHVLFKTNTEDSDVSHGEFVDALVVATRELVPTGANGTDRRGLLNWLHLSDLHFRSTISTGSQVLLDSLLEDIQRRSVIDRSLEKIDLVFVTGDLSFSGQSEEYKHALEFLDKLVSVIRVRRDRIFIVPGNHDVCRSRVVPTASKALLTDRTLVDKVCKDPMSVALFQGRFVPFHDALTKGFSHLIPDEGYLCFFRGKQINGRFVSISGFNTAWSSSEDNEYGKLTLGETQVRAALAARDRKASLNVALFHHPLEWMQEFDRENCAPLLRNQFDVVLHGHAHRTSLLSLGSPSGQTTLLGAGACDQGRELPNAYNYVRINLDSRKGTVYLREYSDLDGGHWASDTRTIKSSNGQCAFHLP